jgi:hypothetical protein
VFTQRASVKQRKKHSDVQKLHTQNMFTVRPMSIQLLSDISTSSKSSSSDASASGATSGVAMVSTSTSDAV